MDARLSSPGSSLRVLLLTQDYPPAVGGIQTYAHALAERLQGRCAALRVMAPDQAGAAEFDRMQTFGTDRVSGGSNWMRVAVLPQLLSVVKKYNLRTVLTGHWFVAAAALAARKMGAVDRVFVAAHGQELIKSVVPRLLTPAYVAHRRRVLHQVDGVFAVSRYTAGLLRDDGVAPERIVVVNNGTDLSRFDLDSSKEGARALRGKLGIGDAKTLVTVARLVPRKGIDRVMDALPGLIERFSDLQYVIAGSGPDRERLEQRAKERGVAERCHFLGRVANEDLPGVYRVGDVFVMPVRPDGASVEGFGLSFCEAGACERPVVGTRCGGIPDAVVDGETGLLVAPEDTADLVSAIERLLSAPDWAAGLGREGRARIARQGTWDHAAIKLVEGMARLNASQ